MTLIWLCSAWLVGIAIADLLGLPMTPPLVLAGGAALLALIWRRSPAVLPLALAAALSLGVARGAAARPVDDAFAVRAYVNRTVVITGMVAQHPDRRDDQQIVVVTVERLEDAGGKHLVRGLVRLELPPAPELRYGQQIEATGRLRSIDAEELVRYRTYLRRQSILAFMERPRVDVIGEGKSSRVLGAVLAANDHARRVVQRLLPEPHAGLLAGMLLGSQAAIPRDVLLNFRKTGTSHLLVVSGWNITLLVGAVTGALVAIGLTRRRALILSLPVLVTYVLFAGASPSLIRAGVMGGLVVWAGLADREADAWTSLVFACALMALLDPNVLWDVGFQLSAGGTAGLILWAAPIRDRLSAWAPLQSQLAAGLVETLSATLAALALTLPVLLSAFRSAPLIAPLANVLLAPAVPPAMFFGIFATVVGLVALPLGQLLALLAWPFTEWLVLGTQLLAHLPRASVGVPAFATNWVWAWYGAVAAFEWRRGRRAHATTP